MQEHQAGHDDEPPAEGWPTDWMRAVLGLCVLRALEAAPSYGYAIVAELERAGLGTVKGGTLYPLLTRYESAGWVATEWKAGTSGPGRKYFSLTAAGRAALAGQRSAWDRFTSTTLSHLGDSGPNPGSPAEPPSTSPAARKRAER
ncbi:PadR family transcriptional regulator [Micrococcaceae bacterium RIT802]|nr:PadR family transcriptional regulator [Micrococcaceae bacterium RIT 802]